LSRIHGNSVAVHQAIRMHQQNHQIAVQNVMQNQMIQRTLLSQVVQKVVEVGPSTEDLQRFIDIISREVDDPGLEFAQVETEIRERTPFAGVLQFLSSSQNRTELATYLGLLLVIFQTVLMMTQKPISVATPEQVEKVVEQVIQQVNQADQPDPPQTTQADCDKEPHKGQRARDD
jgi:hypothetical protein